MLGQHYRITFSNIIRASATQSAITVESRGDDRVMLSSRASRTAATMDAAITNVDANLSLAKDLAKELSELAKQQYEALQKSSYFRMSGQEASAYDARRLRISEICSVLAEFRPKRR
jgi:hypothetical protein